MSSLFSEDLLYAPLVSWRLNETEKLEFAQLFPTYGQPNTWKILASKPVNLQEQSSSTTRSSVGRPARWVHCGGTIRIYLKVLFTIEFSKMYWGSPWKWKGI